MWNTASKFEEMKETNIRFKNLLKWEPVWAWDGEVDEEKLDALDTNRLRILTVTWNMHGKKEPEDIW